MSFQVNSTDLKHGTEITESVSTAEEEFKNSTDEKLRKLFTEDVEKLKNSTDDETDRKLVPEDEEEFKKNRTEQSKRKDKDDDDEEQCCKSSTSVLFLWLCSSGIHLKTSLSYHMVILKKICI